MSSSGSGGEDRGFDMESKLLTANSIASLSEWVDASKSGDTAIRFADRRLLFRASRDGMNPAEFHKRCDNVGATLTVVKAKHSPNIFGGFTTSSWNSTAKGWKSVSSTKESLWLYSVVNALGRPIRLSLNSPGGEGCAMHCDPTTGPAYGNGHDLVVWQGVGGGACYCNDSCRSYSSGPDGKLDPAMVLCGRTHLPQGMQIFTLEELEVFGFGVASSE